MALDQEKHKASRARWRENNPAKVRAYAERYRAIPGRREKAAELTRAWMRARKAKLLEMAGVSACACGEDHPATLDFHHRDSATKLFTVGSSKAQQYSDEDLMAEIAKCEVMCANCHRKHHYFRTP